MKTLSIKIFRWTLRVLSIVIILFSLIMFFGQNSGDLSTNAILQLSITGIGLIGFGLAWKWELTGGIIALVAYLVLAIINSIVLSFSLVLIWPAIAILFIVLWAISRNTAAKKK